MLNLANRKPFCASTMFINLGSDVMLINVVLTLHHFFDYATVKSSMAMLAVFLPTPVPSQQIRPSMVNLLLDHAIVRDRIPLRISVFTSLCIRFFSVVVRS